MGYSGRPVQRPRGSGALCWTVHNRARLCRGLDLTACTGQAAYLVKPCATTKQALLSHKPAHCGATGQQLHFKPAFKKDNPMQHASLQ